MEFIGYIIAPFIALYGLLALLAGPQQWRRGNITTLAANSMMIAGVLLLAAAYLVWTQSQWALWALGIGLLAMHALAAINSIHMTGKPSWNQQGGRFVLSTVFFGLAYLALRS